MEFGQSFEFTTGVLAQLVERLNGIEEVRGSNPLGSTTLIFSNLGFLCISPKTKAKTVSASVPVCPTSF